MCQLKSCLVLKDRIYCPDYDSHDRMLKELQIADTIQNAETLFVRVELTPPNEKPVELMQTLIQQCSKQGDTVLDLFMGSGSVGVAAVNKNRNFIGFELDENYFQIAKQRISTIANN